MFTEDDLVKYSNMAKLIDKAKFELEGSATIPAAMLLQWYMGLGQKIKATIDKEEMQKDAGSLDPKPLDEPVGEPLAEDIGEG